MSQYHPSLILAPSKHTTVVTTTTVTTTNYAPIPLPPIAPPPPPTDPKEYPLLSIPLPKSLREFPITFPDGVRAVFKDGPLDEILSDPTWEEEPARGSGWVLLKPSETREVREEEVYCLSDAVERFSPLRKRQLSSEPANMVVDTTAAAGRYVSPPPRKKARGTEQQHGSTRSAAGPPSPLPSPHGSPSTPLLYATPSHSQSPPDTILPSAMAPFQPDIALTTLLSLPNLVSHFSGLPPTVQSHLLISLLRHSPLQVLRQVHAVLTPTLARDYLTLLPPELVSIVLTYLPPPTLFRASRVSKSWRSIIDADPQVWRDQLRRYGTWYGGPSENAYTDRIWALRKKRYDTPHLFPNLPLPHPFKLLFKSRHQTLTRWQHNAPKRLTFAAHGNSVVTCLIFSRRRIISASDDHSIHMYSPFTGGLVRSFPGHEGGVWALAVCSRRRKPVQSPILTPAQSPTSDGNPPHPYYHDMLVSGSTDRTVRIWDLQTGRNTHVFGGHTSTVRCLVISRPVWIDAEDGTNRKEKWPKHTMIVTGSRDNTLRVWRLPAPGEPEYRCFGAQTVEGDPADEDTNENPYHMMALRGHENAVRALAVHGRTIVSGSYDTTVRVWDLVTGEAKFVLTGHTQKVYSVVIDHMRKQTCSGSMDGTVRIWSLKDGSTRHILSGHTSLVGLLSLSATTLVSAAADSTLRIWDPKEGKLLHTLQGHTGAITCFQHDENKVLSGSDGTLKMWDTRDGSMTRDLLTGITGVWQVVFDRRFCIAASNRQDNTFLEVWDFAGRKGGAGGGHVGGGGGGGPGVDDIDDELMGGGVGGDEDVGEDSDDEDGNSETSDPYDELRLAEGDVEDSESDDEGDGPSGNGGPGGGSPAGDDSDYTMDSASRHGEGGAGAGGPQSPPPSHSNSQSNGNSSWLFGGRGGGGGGGRRHASGSGSGPGIQHQAPTYANTASQTPPTTRQHSQIHGSSAVATTGRRFDFINGWTETAGAGPGTSSSSRPRLPPRQHSSSMDFTETWDGKAVASPSTPAAPNPQAQSPPGGTPISFSNNNHNNPFAFGRAGFGVTAPGLAPAAPGPSTAGGIGLPPSGADDSPTKKYYRGGAKRNGNGTSGAGQ
ncbi:SCF ubiquitin ligase complex subunit cdc4 [Tulasnella sp. 331]|nr:SCF ubiquitin ligase complex subunit cdc4 [Tulasnella sp. 331]